MNDDMTGAMIGTVRVIGRAPDRLRDTQRHWLIPCAQCGLVSSRPGARLRALRDRGERPICRRCSNRIREVPGTSGRPALDLVGTRLGAWTVTRRTGSDDRKSATWELTCTCGATCKRTSKQVRGMTKQPPCSCRPPAEPSPRLERTGRLCQRCVGMPWRRPLRGLCVCGERHEALPTLRAVDFATRGDGPASWCVEAR